jgi:ATP-dependent DNA helicase RecG
MSLPINIKDLIYGKTVEWERLEFKSGWNPEEIVRSICAFANDLHNWGGGYIGVGIDAINGIPVLPPVGLQHNQLYAIQSKVIELGNRIQPAYFPIMQPYEIDGKHILVLWCPAGDYRPYSAPSTLGEKSQRQYYVRVGSNSIVAKDENLNRMFELAARVPFDDRINRQATIDDFDLSLIQQYLHEVKSDLYEESKKISLAELARDMHIAKGSDELLLPVNVGLLFFTNEPEKYFPRTWIEVVWHRDDVGDNFTEHYFKGALHIQLRNALSFIKENMIHEQVHKIPNQAEAKRFYNYPYEAFEEALSNAVYHKAYDLGKPIEVQIYPDRIIILSYPGAMPPVNYQIRNHQKIVARDYRNRRIGDFLKELDLTEGRNTGFQKMIRKLKDNGSPDPTIEVDEYDVSFLITLPIHSEYVEMAETEKIIDKDVNGGVSGGVNGGVNGGNIEKTILELVQNNDNINSKRIKQLVNIPHRTIERYLSKLKAEGLIEFRGTPKTGGYSIKRLD